MSEPTLREHLEMRRTDLSKDMSEFRAHWQQIQEFILPRRGRWLEDDRGKVARFTSIVNNTGTRASRTLAAGMQAGITSPARRWFRLQHPDPDMNDWGPAKEWLERVAGVMYKIYSQSNVYNALHSTYKEEGVFGTGAMGLFEDFNDVVRAYPLTAGSYAVATDDRGVVDTLSRPMRMTVKQIHDKFGKAAMGRQSREAWSRKQYSALITVYHLTEPNKDRFPALGLVKDKPFRSVYYEKGSDPDETLEVRGFEEFPFFVPRWEVLGDDVWGMGPGSLALGDVKALQAEERDKAKGIQKSVDPPLVGPSQLREEVVSTIPGRITYSDTLSAGQGLRPIYEVRPDISGLQMDIQEIQRRVDDAFFVNLFLMLANDNRSGVTATEVAERHEEKLLMLGPMLERLHDEMLDPLVDRTFNMAMRAGILPEPPEELKEVELSVEYVSILAQAQKAVSTSAIERSMGFAGNLMAVFPELRHKIDPMDTLETYHDLLGAPQSMLRSTDEAMQRAAAEQQAAQQQQMAAMTAQAAQSAKVLSDTETGDGRNALQDLIGGGAPR